MQHREVGLGCSNDVQEPSNIDTSTACAQHSERLRDVTSFGNSSMNDHESDNSYPQVPYPHNMLVWPSYWSFALCHCVDDWPSCKYFIFFFKGQKCMVFISC